MAHLSSEMIKLIKEQTQQVLDGESKIFDPSTINSAYAPSIVYPMPLSTAKKIDEHFRENLSPSLKSKMIIQPFDSFHFTINWYSTEQTSKATADDTINVLKDKLNFSQTTCTAFSPLIGHIGPYVSLDEEGQKIIQENRKIIYEEWSKFGITPAFPPDGFIPYAYLARYTAPLSQEDKEFLNQLTPARFQIKLDTILFLVGDKFLSPKTREIYHTWELR